MCVDCVLASPRITQVDPGDEPLSEVVLLQPRLGWLLGQKTKYNWVGRYGGKEKKVGWKWNFGPKASGLRKN
jgi:hypothetical protein